MHHTVVDFETDAIEDRPKYPPRPVGVALLEKNGDKSYLAWGHPTENNCTRQQARDKLKSLWSRPLLFHNAAFDIEVAMEHLGLPMPEYWDDTLILAYLSDPRAPSLSLKPMAASILKMPPDEQTKLRDWIVANVPEARKRKTKWGAYISRAPGRLVGRYAVGDVVRTARLFRHFYKDVFEAGMLPSYDRERRIISVKLAMEKPGLRVAPKIKRDAPKFRRAHADAGEAVRKYLRQPKGFNPGSNPQLAEALVQRKKLSHIVRTKKGQISTKREVLEENCNDKNLLRLLSIYGVLSTYTGTFIEPWLRSFEDNAGLIFPTYNTVRSTDEYGGGGVGTRTGRFSSSRPNFQNIPANVEESRHRDVLLAVRRYLADYGLSFVGLRDYIVPRDGRVFVARDYDQQELRILAHYEDGELLARYIADPKLDVHAYARGEIYRLTRLMYERKAVKIVVFGLLYGQGAAKLAKNLGLSMEEARKLKKAVLQALPGIEWLDKELQKLAEEELPIYTWGGRRYYAELDRWIEDNGEWRRRRMWYKLLNLLIQGSAADVTKTGMLQVVEACDPRYFTLLVQVHDELLAEVDAGKAARQSRLMKEAMEDLKLDLPLTTSAKTGATSWARLKEEKQERNRRRAA